MVREEPHAWGAGYLHPSVLLEHLELRQTHCVSKQL